MPAQAKRKLMKLGSSAVIAIPPDYRKYHHLNLGDEVEILYDSLVLIIPMNRKHLLIEKKELIDALLRS